MTRTAYHLVGETLRDGRPIPADGEWLEHEGPVIPCESGLHASECPFDALQYAPGNTLCFVEIDGDIAEHGKPVDKIVGRRRRIICRFDAEKLLRRFAADCALSVAHLWDMPQVVREYLETLDESKRAAVRAAARAAAWATWAARAAARDAWAAANDVSAATRDAAWATWAAQREQFRQLVDAEFSKIQTGGAR